MRVLIVDDEALACRGIRARLNGFPEVTIAGECSDGQSAIEAIRTLSPDLVFLDVQMPGMSGFEVLQRIEQPHRFAAIFLTAFQEYALPAFAVHAFDYLVKPIDDRRFAEATQRAIDHFAQGSNHRHGGAHLDSPYIQRLAVHNARRTCFLKVDEIAWVQACGDYVSLHANNRTYLIRETLSNLEQRLDPNQFVRIHRSAIVRIDCIRELEALPNRDCLVRLHSGTQLRLSRSYRDKLDALLR